MLIIYSTSFENAWISRNSLILYVLSLNEIKSMQESGNKIYTYILWFISPKKIRERKLPIEQRYILMKYLIFLISQMETECHQNILYIIIRVRNHGMEREEINKYQCFLFFWQNATQNFLPDIRKFEQSFKDCERNDEKRYLEQWVHKTIHFMLNQKVSRPNLSAMMNCLFDWCPSNILFI